MDNDKRKESLQRIFDTFIAKDSQIPVNITDAERDLIQKATKSDGLISPDIFSDIKKEMEIIMMPNFTRFVQSPFYIKVLSKSGQRLTIPNGMDTPRIELQVNDNSIFDDKLQVNTN